MTNTYIKKLNSFKKRLMKKVGLGLLLSTFSLLCTQSQASIIGSFDTGVDVEISSTVSNNEFETYLFYELVDVEGSASGDNSGSSFSNVVLGANETGTISAAANGQVDGIGGFVQSSWETDGFFYLENNTGSNISVDVTVDITWFATIFTSSSDEEAYATAGVFIEDSSGARVFEDWIELDSLIQGPGTFGVSDSFAVNFIFDLAVCDFQEYFLVVDSFGFAESLQQVPEPSSLLLIGLPLLFAIRKRKINFL